ncbi:MAG: hypothetical protein AB1746_03935 [Candidatus Zixiibacteriota bacterium]
MFRKSYHYLGLTLLTGLFLAMISASPALAKGTAHQLEFVDGTDEQGQIIIKVGAEKSDGSIDEYQFNIWIDDPPVDENWKADQFYNDITQYEHFDAEFVTSNKIRFWIADDCPHYEDIKNISVEDDTDETVIIDDDPALAVPIVQLSLDITGTGNGGTFTFGIADPAFPKATVPTTGLTGDQIEDNLVIEFNGLNDYYSAAKVGGIIIVENVPCPLGVLAGTTDTALTYIVKTERTRWGHGVPSLGQWSLIILMAVLIVSGTIVITRRRRLSAN